MTHPIYPPLALGALLALAAVGAQGTNLATDSLLSLFDDSAAPAQHIDAVTKISSPGHADFIQRP